MELKGSEAQLESVQDGVKREEHETMFIDFVLCEFEGEKKKGVDGMAAREEDDIKGRVFGECERTEHGCTVKETNKK